MQGIMQLPNSVVNIMVDKIKALSEKYSVTYSSVVSEINVTASALSKLIDELVGNEYDMKGLSEFKTLINGE